VFWQPQLGVELVATAQWPLVAPRMGFTYQFAHQSNISAVNSTLTEALSFERYEMSSDPLSTPLCSVF
jgi:hypothetical protein